MKRIFTFILTSSVVSYAFGQGTIDVTPKRLESKAAEKVNDDAIKEFTKTNKTTWLQYQVRTNDLARSALEQGFPPSIVDNSYLSIVAGAYLLNPYKLGADNKLEKGDAEAPFFFQFSYDNVWAWNAIRRQYTWDHGDGNLFKRKRFIDYIDFQGKLWAFLHGDSDKTNVSTIVGSGDFSAEGTFTLNLWQSTFGLENDANAKGVALKAKRYSRIYDQTIFAQSFGPCISYGAVTDREAFDLHSRVLTGVSYKAGIKVGQTDPGELHREGLINVQLGYAWIDQLQFVSEDSREIKLTHESLPDYKFEGGFAVEAEVFYPIGKDLFLTAGARLYAQHDPNPWNAHLGITWSVERLLKTIGLSKE